MFRLQSLLLSLMIAFGVVGAEEAPAAPVQRDRGGDGGGRSDMRRRFSEINDTLREKYPDEFAAMEKLRETDRRAAMEKFRELATKAGVEMPSFGGGRRDRMGVPAEKMKTETSTALQLIREKFPEEFGEDGKLKEIDPAVALEKLRSLAEKTEVASGSGGISMVSPRNRHRLMTMRADRLLAEIDAESFAYLEELRTEDPDAARRLFRDMLKNANLTSEILGRPLPGEKPVLAVLIPTPATDANNAAGNAANSGGSRRGGFGGGNNDFSGGPPMGPPPGGPGE